MSESVIVNVSNGNGGGRSRLGWFSNIGRAPWWVQVPLLVLVVYLIATVLWQVLGSIYDFAIPLPLEFLTDPRTAGAATTSAIQAFLGGAWNQTGIPDAAKRLEESRYARFVNSLPNVRIFNWGKDWLFKN